MHLRLRPSLWVTRVAALLAVCTGLSPTAAGAQAAPHHAVSGSRFEHPADCAQSSDWEAAMRKATEALLSRAGLTLTCLPTAGEALRYDTPDERYLVLANGLGSVSGSASRLRFFYIFPLDAKGRLRRAPIKTWATDFTHSLFGALNERGGVGFLALRRESGPDNHRFKAEVFHLTPRGLQQTGTKKEFELSP